MNNNHRLCLAEDGRTQYKIVIPEGASETLKYAAEELSKYLKEISGAVFPSDNRRTIDTRRGGRVDSDRLRPPVPGACVPGRVNEAG